MAIAHAVRGKYGELFGLSVVAFERFIEQYLPSEDRPRGGKGKLVFHEMFTEVIQAIAFEKQVKG
ncbi:hypothetical protein [Mucilaginibacter sp. BT774]|uniref:hypothetical protein n=1 Tax=Mucilaginibacter sp. BT774 TaxID=3062276 RepID=UPI0026744827|nr:hypothetical protein [Mucilaginibacter sp. BT774]MDO3624684.1 hypothetical protein [Mucilaginibacter sp. BT774]